MIGTSPKRAVLIAGATASGKSALAVALAQRLGGIVINADSMQVYRDLRVITARPSLEEERAAPHRLYGDVDAAENYSVGRWCVDAMAAIAGAREAGQLPILVGGTGLYFKSLLGGLAAIPPTPQAIRDAVRARLVAEGAETLHAELARSDPATAARLMPRDSTRITRALEVLAATGRPITDWHRDGMPPAFPAGEAVTVFLDRPREELYPRIDARFDEMLSTGALDEVRALAARGLDPLLPAMKAHGVPWLLRCLRGEISLEEAAEGGKRDTRRYTKRQATWFRNQLPGFAWVTPDAALDAISAKLASPAP